MRTNGKVKYMVMGSEAPEFDDSGLPASVPSKTWTEGVECFIQTLTDNKQGKYVDGTFRQDSYRVLIEGLPTHTDRVKLFKDSGAELGEYVIESVQTISLDRVELICRYAN